MLACSLVCKRYLGIPKVTFPLICAVGAMLSLMLPFKYFDFSVTVTMIMMNQMCNKNIKSVVR